MEPVNVYHGVYRRRIKSQQSRINRALLGALFSYAEQVNMLPGSFYSFCFDKMPCCFFLCVKRGAALFWNARRDFGNPELVPCGLIDTI